MPPVLVAGAELLLDQQAAKARAVDEQVAGEDGAVGEGHGADMAAFRIERGIDDLAFGSADAVRFGMAAKEARIEAGVEVEGVEQLREGKPGIGARAGEAPEPRRGGAHRPGRDVVEPPAPALAQVELVEMDSAEILAVVAERMEVALAGRAPVDELDAELERALGRGDELVLVDPEHVVVGDERRNRRLADPDGADLVRLDEVDPDAPVEQSGEGGRGHPPRRAAADDHDVADIVLVHRRRPLTCHGSAWPHPPINRTNGLSASAA